VEQISAFAVREALVECARMIEPVLVDDIREVEVFIQRVVMLAVDATEEEKASFLKNIHRNLEQWRAEPTGALHLKFVEGGALAGVVMVKSYWNLCHLFVAPELHGRGIGRALLTAALEGCRGKSPRGLVRLNSSRNAAGFYEHMGFHLVPDAPPPYAGIQYELGL
jgi:GNAT superfamily N-acetyltransferase